MSKEYTFIVHTIAEDGLPPEDLEKAGLTGRVAFIFDNSNIYCGWPHRNNEEDQLWVDSRLETKFEGVKKWIELSVPAWDMQGEEDQSEDKNRTVSEEIKFLSEILPTMTKPHQHTYHVTLSHTTIVRWCPECGMTWVMEGEVFKRWKQIKEE